VNVNLNRLCGHCSVPAALLASLTILLTSSVLFTGCREETKKVYPPADLRTELQRARIEKAWPGAVLTAGSADSVYFLISEGFRSYEEKDSVREDAVFDLASITKVIATTSMAMKLYEDGKLDLDWPLIRLLPEFTGPDSLSSERKKGVTFRHLLTHSAGLPAFRHFWAMGETLEARLDSVYATRLDTSAGLQFVYSDIGLILLAKALERIAGTSMPEYLQENIYGPLSMKDTGFNPDSSLFERIMPTEYSKAEGGYVLGHVHDENAYSLGGAAGHAGLFSTAEDLGAYASMLLRGGSAPDGRSIFLPSTLDLFFRPANIIPGSSRCLGWDSPEGRASGGIYISSRAVGHTGFTGTSLWVDLENDLYVILLSNAVHPDRSWKSPNYFDWRQRIHSRVYEHLGHSEKNPALQYRDRWN